MRRPGTEQDAQSPACGLLPSFRTLRGATPPTSDRRGQLRGRAGGIPGSGPRWERKGASGAAVCGHGDLCRSSHTERACQLWTWEQTADDHVDAPADVGSTQGPTSEHQGLEAQKSREPNCRASTLSSHRSEVGLHFALADGAKPRQLLHLFRARFRHPALPVVDRLGRHAYQARQIGSREAKSLPC